MNRIYLCIAGIFALFYACSNNLETIGQDIVDNDNYIGTEVRSVVNTATIRLDSFITSCGVYGRGTVPENVLIGKYNESHGGTTTAIPCFQLSRPASPYINSIEAVLDSAIFCIHLGKGIWGDTAYNIQEQKFDIYRLKKVPTLIYEEGPQGYFHNTSFVDYDENAKIGELSFLPKNAYINDAWARIDDELAEIMFEEMKYPSNTNFYENDDKFFEFFKGLAIVPREENNCIIALNANDTLYIEFIYKQGSQENLTKQFRINRSEYLYNTYQTDRTGTPLEALETQRNEVTFDEAGFALTQGLSGYAVKFQLPYPAGDARYTTLLKAQLEVKVRYAADADIATPSSLSIYRLSDENDFESVLSTNSGTTITGIPQTSNNANELVYVFDLTEYYQDFIDAGAIIPSERVAITVPDISTSYDYAIVTEEPLVRFYYAKYK